MKIAEICPYDMGQPGGVQTHIRDLSDALREAGHEVTIISPGADRGPSEIGVGRKRRLTFNKTAFDISIALGSDHQRLKNLLAEQRFDVIHYHTIWTPLLPAQVLRLSKAADVATFHDTPPETFGGRMTRHLFRAISRWLLPRLHGAIAVSDSPAGHLARIPGHEPRILPPCADFRRFFAGATPFPEYDDGRVNILFLGRLEERKGALPMLHAFRLLQGHGLQVRLLLAGDGEQATQVDEFIAEHQLEHVVRLGRIAEADKARWYASCDIFCSPALYGESFGIVLVEAMASGRPVVAAANSGYSTVLTGPGSRFLAPPGDYTALYERLRALVESPELRNEMGAWGREQARRYDCRQLLPEFEAVFRNALAQRSKRDLCG